MNNTLIAEPTEEEAVQIQQKIQQYLAEVEQLRERMQHDQLEIEASRARTDVMLTRIQAQLAQMQTS
jgi:hypothetical protein